ncbi:MAG: hypothetical protein IJZ96_00850 [Lachnospiraceae bacterium]|nr:hypothetical protein [Lachnospiraceae bacterium]
MRIRRNLRVLCVVLGMMVSLCGCGEKSSGNETQTTEATTANVDVIDEIILDGDMTLEKVETLIEQDTEETVAALSAEWEALQAEVNTYEKYLENSDQVELFYGKIYQETELLAVRLREYCVVYAKLIVDSDMSSDDMYDELKEIYDSLYDDAGEVIYDEIYDGILDDMYEYYYDGILDDAYDDAEYDQWSDARSEEYDWWSDARSDVYDEYSDYRSDAYDFYSDLRSDVYDEDIEAAKEDISDLEKNIMKMKE